MRNQTEMLTREQDNELHQQELVKRFPTMTKEEIEKLEAGEITEDDLKRSRKTICKNYDELMKHRIHPLDNFSPISRVRTIENKRKREWKQIDEYIGMTREQFMRGLVTRVSSRYQIRDDRGHLIGYWSNHEPEDITSIVDNRVVFKKPIMNVQELQQVA